MFNVDKELIEVSIRRDLIKDKITDDIIKKSFKPYDIVSDKTGSLGFIQDVNFNRYQPEEFQVSYSIHWVMGKGDRHSWYDHDDLTRHGNVFIEIAKMATDHRCGTEGDVERIFSLGI